MWRGNKDPRLVCGLNTGTRWGRWGSEGELVSGRGIAVHETNNPPGAVEGGCGGVGGDR